MLHALIAALPQVHADNGGTAVLSPGWLHPRRNLISSVLILGLRGSVRLEAAGEPLEVLPGRVVLLPAGRDHGGAAALADPASYYWLHFTLPGEPPLLTQDEADTILSSQGVTSHRLDEAALVPLQFDLPEAGPFRDAFREVLNQQEKPAYTGWKFQLMFQSLLIQLTETVIGAHQPPRDLSSSSSVVYGILARIAEGLTDPNLSIKTIAADLGLNLDYAGRRFKQVMGLSVGEYLLKARLKQATLRLQQTADTLPAVAEACGFGSTRHFLRQFKASYGLTPSEVRTRHRLMHFNVV